MRPAKKPRPSGAGGLRVRARIGWHFGASAGEADARRRDAGDVVISSRSGNAAAPLRAAARRAAGRSSGWLCCSLLTYGLGIARRSRLASGPGGLQQNVKLFLREPLVSALRLSAA